MKYVIGLDISTSATGICVMDTNGNLVNLDVVIPKVTTKIVPTLMERADLIKSFLEQFKIFDVVDIFIETPLLSSNNTFTIATLLKFNGMVSRDCYNLFGIEPKYYTLNEIRKQFLNEYVTIKGTLSLPKGMKSPEKKELVRQKVALLEPQIVWNLKKTGTQAEGNLDMSDAYGLSLAALVINGYHVVIPKLLNI